MSNLRRTEKRVFMVDDQEWTIAKLKDLFIARGFGVDYASRLDDALSYLVENDYDAVITDHDMEGLDGLQFLQLMRGEETDDREVQSVIDESFTDDEYRAFVSKHSNATYILFTANQHIEPPDDVFVARKNNDDACDVSAEKKIVSLLS